MAIWAWLFYITNNTIQYLLRVLSNNMENIHKYHIYLFGKLFFTILNLKLTMKKYFLFIKIIFHKNSKQFG